MRNKKMRNKKVHKIINKHKDVYINTFRWNR